MKTQPNAEAIELGRLRARIKDLEDQILARQLNEESLSNKASVITKPQVAQPIMDDVISDSWCHFIDDGVIAVNAAGKFVLVNTAAQRLIGIRPAPEGDGWASKAGFFRPDRITPYPTNELPLYQALAGTTIRNELVYVANETEEDGAFFSFSATPIRVEGDKISGAVTFFHDVTSSQLRRVEHEHQNLGLAQINEETESKKKLLESIFERIDIGISVSNEFGDFTLFNSAARRLLGAGPVSGVQNWAPQYGCFRMDGAVYPPDELPLARALRGETVHGDELFIYNPETEKNVLLSVSAAPILTPSSGIEGAICLFYDITGEREAKAIFEIVLENIEIAVTLVDSSGEFVLFNQAARQLLGVDPDDGKDKWGKEYGIYQRNGQPYASENLPLNRALHGESVHDEELRIYNPERGKQIVLKVTATPFDSPLSNFRGALCFAYDITDTSEAERQVATSEERFRAFMTNLPAVAFIKDEHGRYLYGNDAFFDYHLTSPERIQTGTVTDYELTSFECAETIRANDKQIISGVVPIKVSEVLVNQKGESTWFDVYKFRLAGPNNERLLAGIAVDITVRREHARQLEADEKHLRDVILLQEKERLLVAHDIHDGFVQEVVGAKMLSESLVAKIGHDLDVNTSVLFEQINNALARAINDARRLVAELRPLVIDNGGITEAIRHLISEKRYAESAKITFSSHGTAHFPDPLLEGNLFRLVQESLNNIIRHSEAGSVSIELTSTDSHVTLSVTDDGIGFEPKNVSPDRFGIRGMRERARVFGGNLKVSSSPGRGTIITATIPCKIPPATVNTSD